jgi:hypothetical protein
MSKRVPQIEVTTQNMLNWMQERRMLPNEWLKKLQAADAKFSELRQNFPKDHAEDAVRAVFDFIKTREEDSNGNLTYSDAKEVFRLLTQTTTEASAKTFLGYYKSPLALEWQLLCRIYESENLFRAEGGKTLQQVSGFDLPAMKKALTQGNKAYAESKTEQERLTGAIAEIVT